MADVRYRIDVRGNRAPDLLRSPTYTQVWTPDTDIAQLYDAWLHKLLYAREPAIVLIDELASLPNDMEKWPGLIKLLKQGRKHGTTMIVLTQEIANVTLTVFRQMSHFANFRINNEIYDLSMARKYLNIAKEEQRPPTNQYGFFYRKTSGQFPMREFASMQAFFKNHI